MDLMDKVTKYLRDNIQNDLNTILANEDFTTFMRSLIETLNGRGVILGGFQANKIVNGTNKMRTNKMNQNRRQNNQTLKNIPDPDETRYKTSILLTFLLLGSICHLRGQIPLIHSFVQLLTIYNKEAYAQIISPSIQRLVENPTFKDLTTSLSVAKKEEIYFKLLTVLNGSDRLNDKPQLMDAEVKIGKIHVLMVAKIAPLLRLQYIPSVDLIQETEVKTYLRDVLRVINTTYKGPKGFTFMEVPLGAYIMVPKDPNLPTNQPLQGPQPQQVF